MWDIAEEVLTLAANDRGGLEVAYRQYPGRRKIPPSISGSSCMVSCCYGEVSVH